MIVGYKPYFKSVVFRMCRRNTCAVLTEISAMKVKPGSPNVEIVYKTCDSAVNYSVIINASGSDIPKCSNKRNRTR
jgi:hypothetical protein